MEAVWIQVTDKMAELERDHKRKCDACNKLGETRIHATPTFAGSVVPAATPMHGYGYNV